MHTKLVDMPDFLKKYSKTLKLEYFEDMGSQKAAKNLFFAKHQGKWRHFCKQISQEGLICLAKFMGLIGKEFYGEKTKLLYIKERRKLGYYGSHIWITMVSELSK